MAPMAPTMKYEKTALLVDEPLGAMYFLKSGIWVDFCSPRKGLEKLAPELPFWAGVVLRARAAVVTALEGDAAQRVIARVAVVKGAIVKVFFGADLSFRN